MLCPTRTYIHAITPQAVDLEAQQIEAALTRGGYDPHGLDFGQQAAHRLVDETIETVRGVGIDLTRKHWTRTSDGGVEVAMEVGSELEVPLMRVVIG